MQMVLHKITAGLGAPPLLGERHYFLIAHAGGQIVQQADTVYIGNGFNIESENGGHGACSVAIDGIVHEVARFDKPRCGFSRMPV